jgi:hypothetical protein
MRQFTISTAAAIVLAATFASAPAKADYNYGPTVKGTQCWKRAPIGSNESFGSWGACPQAASTTTVRPARRHRHS